ELFTLPSQFGLFTSTSKFTGFGYDRPVVAGRTIPAVIRAESEFKRKRRICHGFRRKIEQVAGGHG
ncbi:MAG: hypothetical protein ACLFS7_09320, partial [Desulfosudaceae bacterium]